MLSNYRPVLCVSGLTFQLEIQTMASSVADSSSSTNANGGGGKRTSKRKRPRSQSTAAVEDRGDVKLQEEDFTW